MDILLWRHAEAEDGPDDMERALTAKGQRQARVMGDWIRARMKATPVVLVSPARRAQETAAALDLPFRTEKALQPSSTWSEIVALYDQVISQHVTISDGALLLVAHQPALGQVAAALMTGTAHDWAIQKAGVWWLRNKGGSARQAHQLLAAIHPKLL